MEPKKNNLKSTIIIAVIVGVLVTFLGLHIGHSMDGYYKESNGNTLSGITTNGKQFYQANNFIDALLDGIEHSTSDPFDFFPVTSSAIIPILVMLFIIACVAAISYFRWQIRAEVMTKNQHGSSKWTTNYKSYNEKFTTPWADKHLTPDPNVILSENVRLGTRISDVNNQRNLNTAIIGGSGSGKTFREVKPNIMQLNSSFVVTDPSGDILECVGKGLIESGYKLKLFSTSDMPHSNCYNPFDYVYDENGGVDETKVSTLIYLFLRNANGAKEKASGDPFWEKSAKALLSAIAYYMLENEGVSKESINFTTMLKMIQSGKVSEESSTSQSALDKLMEEEKIMAEKNGRISKAISNYNTFKLATGKTANSILITCAVDLQLFDNRQVQDLTKTDIADPSNNINFDMIGDEKTALFINIPQANGTFNFLVAMMYSQLFDTIYTKGEKIYPNKYIIRDKYGEPLFTMLNSEDEAKDIINSRAFLTVEERTNKRGAKFYQIKNGRKVLREMMSKPHAEKVIESLVDAKVERGKKTMPIHIRCLLDEFANIGIIPDFPERLATVRRYNLSCTIILQNISQLKKMYDKEWEGILGNCDSKVFLGSSENETCEYFSKLLGNQTIVIRNRSRSMSAKGGNSSQSYNYNKRALMEASELANLDGRKCIVIIRGVDPFLDNKYNFLAHPNFHLTGDSDSNQKFDNNLLDMYFNNTDGKKSGVKKKKPINKKISQTLKVESKPINSKQELFSTIGTTNEVEFLDKISKSPTTFVPKPTIKTNNKTSKKVEKEDPLSNVSVAEDEDNAFFFV